MTCDDRPSLFFDLDGTLAESADGIVASLEHAISECGVASAKIDWRRHIGPPLQRMLEVALPDLDPARRFGIGAAFREHYDSEGMFLTKPFPGVVEMLRSCADRGSPVYVVTNKLQTSAEAMVRHLEFAGIVRRIVGGDLAGHSTKPDRAAALVAEENVAGGFFIGDGVDDLAAADRIGARFLLAGWGYGSARVLAQRPDVAVLKQPADVLTAVWSTGG